MYQFSRKLSYVAELVFELATLELQSDALLLPYAAWQTDAMTKTVNDSIGLDTSGYQGKYFSHFSMKTYVVGSH